MQGKKVVRQRNQIWRRDPADAADSETLDLSDTSPGEYSPAAKIRPAPATSEVSEFSGAPDPRRANEVPAAITQFPFQMRFPSLPRSHPSSRCQLPTFSLPRVRSAGSRLVFPHGRRECRSRGLSKGLWITRNCRKWAGVQKTRGGGLLGPRGLWLPRTLCQRWPKMKRHLFTVLAK